MHVTHLGTPSLINSSIGFECMMQLIEFKTQRLLLTCLLSVVVSVNCSGDYSLCYVQRTTDPPTIIARIHVECASIRL